MVKQVALYHQLAKIISYYGKIAEDKADVYDIFLKTLRDKLEMNCPAEEAIDIACKAASIKIAKIEKFYHSF
jgi:hypothetical protein